MLIIGNHEYKLQFTMPVWENFEKKVGLVDDFDDIIGKPGRLRKIALMVAIMSVEQPVSEQRIFDDMEPRDVRVAVQEIRRAIGAGLKMETEKGEDEVVDEVLEEIAKKEAGAELPIEPSLPGE